MSTINDGGAAFPIPLNPGQSWQGIGPCDGMTLRDKFAESALIGLLAEPIGPGVMSSVRAITNRNSDTGTDVADHFAEAAYALADAMLRQREKGAAS